MSEVMVPEATEPGVDDEATNDAAWARWLRTPAAIRARTGRLLEFGVAGRLPHFVVRPERLDAVADRVAAVTRRAYPDLDIPVHGRFTHFDVGGVARVAELDAALAATGLDPVDKARAKIDLVVVSVLLDAGAGPAWKYVENGVSYARSEGLAVASLRMFMAGGVSSGPARPLGARPPAGSGPARGPSPGDASRPPAAPPAGTASGDSARARALRARRGPGRCGQPAARPHEP